MANLRVDKITSTETFETTGSVQFDGTTGQLTVSGSDSATTYDFGTDDFTIEFWRYKSSSAVESYVARLDAAGGSATSDFWFGNVNGVDGFYYYEGTTGRNLSTESQPLNTWAHLAVVRYNDYLTLYLNGKEVTSRPHSAAFNNGSANLRIGGDGASSGNTNYPLEGFLSNVRITKKALYTSNFKPSMRELEVTAETVLLACQSKTDATLEKTGKTLVVGGTPVASELTPGLLTPIVKSGGGSAITGSVEFTGSPSKLTADSVDFAMGSNDLTMECWFYNGVDTITHLLQIDTGTYQSPSDITNFSLATRDAAAGDIRFLIRNDSGSNLSDLVAGAPGAKINAWHHLAGTIEGTTTRLFLNGILIASGTISGTRTHTGQRCTIGANQTSRYLKGYLSNVRIVKGTALYTADFIPPTRELKNVPGTVLLCCQDPDNSLTEATGKTITGYGDLQRADGVELIANGHFSSNTDNWTAVGNASLSTSSGQIVLTGDGSTAGGGAAQGFATIVGKKYVLKYEAFSGTISAGQIRIGTSANSFSITFDNSVSASAHDDITFVATSTTTYVTLGLNAGVATSGTFKYDNVSVTLVDGSNKGSNFTPQVGDDRKVTFEGVTKINSDAYFYLPTGDTVTRDSRSGRGIFSGRYTPTNFLNTIEYIQISTQGNSKSFGDLISPVQIGEGGKASNHIRGLTGGGSGSPGLNQIEYITIATTGNGVDFGDLTENRRSLGGAGSNTRAVFCGGTTGSMTDRIDYVTTASLGDAADFGNLLVARRNVASNASPTRGVFAGGNPGPSPYTDDTIDYITMATTGDAADFGNLSVAQREQAGGGNTTRGLIAGGYTAPAGLNTISYITVASLGNTQDFGDMTVGGSGRGGTSNTVNCVFGGGSLPAYTNTMDFVKIASTGNAQDFGDLNYAPFLYSGQQNSDSHGGLG